eukprot:COSAG05_NODE_153_length_15894_cov_27.910415_6_plen_70_part_00
MEEFEDAITLPPPRPPAKSTLDAPTIFMGHPSGNDGGCTMSFSSIASPWRASDSVSKTWDTHTHRDRPI